MNRAQTIAVDQPWVSGPFRWPREVNLKLWEMPEPKTAPARINRNDEVEEKVLEALRLGLSMTPSNIAVNIDISVYSVAPALKRLAEAGLVERVRPISNFWRLA